MKLAKLSLAAIVVAGLASSSFAADNLADMFKNGKVSGELKAYYFDRDKGTKFTTAPNDADIITGGVTLGYVTDSFYGFKLGATVQSSYSPWADKDAKFLGNAENNTIAMFSDMYGSGAVFSELYAEYTLGKTVAKVGRQYISTPLVNGSGSRVIKQSFQGVTVVNTDLPQTTLEAGYINRYQDRSTKGDAPKFVKAPVGDDGAYTLLAINKSVPGLTITAQWAQIVDLIDLYYGELAYAGKAGSFDYGFAGQYLKNKYEAKQINFEDADSAGYYGLKASMGISGFSMYLAYSKTEDKANVTYGLGGGADIMYTGNVIKGGIYTPDTAAYTVDANYAILPNFKVGARYSITDYNEEGFKKEKSLTGYTEYAFDGSLKGLSLSLQYEKGTDSVTYKLDNKDATKSTITVADVNELRFRVNYKF